MTIMQYAIARSARQIADRINAGEVLTQQERENSVVVYAVLGEQLRRVSEDEYAACVPVLRHFWTAAATVERWRLGYVTLTTPTEADIATKMSEFVDRLQQEVHPVFPLRTVPLRINVFTPTEGRIGPNQLKALQCQETAVAAWKSELCRRFTQEQMAKNITEHSLDTK